MSDTAPKRNYTLYRQSIHSPTREEVNQRLSETPNSGQVSTHIEARTYSPPSWLTASGICKKRRQIELRGIPSMHHWRFITLTLSRKSEENPNGFDCPLEGYLAGKKHLKRFMEDCRASGLWEISHKWAWKLEFHSDGWPHWHLLVSRTRIYSPEQLQQITALWKLGRTNCEMVNETPGQFLYSFKYAFKGIIQRDESSDIFEDDACCVPDWFLDYSGHKLITVKWTDDKGNLRTAKELKPVTFQKIRFWQTSKDFYTGQKPASTSSEKVQVTWTVPLPVRVSFERADSRIQVVARNRRGNYATSAIINLTDHRAYLFMTASRAHTYDDALALGVGDYFIPIVDLTKHTEPNQKCKLQHLIQKNRLSLHHARTLQRREKSWKTS